MFFDNGSVMALLWSSAGSVFSDKASVLKEKQQEVEGEEVRKRILSIVGGSGVGVVIGQIYYMWETGRFLLWPYIHLFGEWHKVPFWP